MVEMTAMILAFSRYPPRAARPGSPAAGGPRGSSGMDKTRAATGPPARLARRTGGLVLAAFPAVAAEVNTPIISGIAFRSGATGASQCLAALRGRKLDVNHVFLTHKSFPLLVKNAGALAGAAKAAPLLVASVPLLTADTHAQFAQCAAGAFDGYFRQIGANLQKVGAQGVRGPARL